MIFLGSTLKEVSCSMTTNLDSLLRDNFYTISSVPLHLASTPWYMLDVLQRSTLMHHLTKFVFSVVEYDKIVALPFSFHCFLIKLILLILISISFINYFWL